MMMHDPMAVIGFALVGASATLSMRLHRKLLDVGVDTSTLFVRVPTLLFGPFRVHISRSVPNTAGQRGLHMLCGCRVFRESPF